MKHTISISIAIGVFLLSGCGASPTEPPAPTPTEAPAEPTHSNLPYMDDDNPKHTLDIYLPDEVTEAIPTLLMIHGSLDSKDDHSEVGNYFAEQGYAVVMTEYQTDNGQQTAIQELFCSLAWVHSNAEKYGVDSQRIYLFGYSLGGYFSATLGSIKDPSNYQEGCPQPIPETNRAQGIITFAGLFGTPDVCMSPQGGWCLSGFASGNNMPLPEMLGIFEALREVPPSNWKDSSELSDEIKHFAEGLPLYWIDGSEPPFLIIHGDADDMVPVGESEAFVNAVQANGGEVKLLIIPGAGHFSLSLASPSFAKISEAVEDFISER